MSTEVTSPAVIVVGGGIGGLAAAVGLHRVGCRVTVLERASAFRRVGAGLTLAPNAVRALDALGLGEQLRARGMAQGAAGLRTWTGRWLMRTRVEELEQRFGVPTFALHRADLHDMLIGSLSGGDVRTGHTVTGLDGGRVLYNGPGGPGELNADLVIASSWTVLDEHRRLLAAAERVLPAERIRHHHNRVLTRVERLITRGRDDGTFRTDLPLNWLVTHFYATLHSAAQEVAGGRLGHAEAAEVVHKTLPDPHPRGQCHQSCPGLALLPAGSSNPSPDQPLPPTRRSTPSRSTDVVPGVRFPRATRLPLTCSDVRAPQDWRAS
ncbi:FAD-dependent monooxygenase [Streptosporangium roseum]|uniref:FAD-dependent monooxygenase n=1 Tax=Streptosporangium roseum TaxID=2001 RepID=UPI00331BE599